MKKIVKMLCPSCGNSYDEKEQHFILNPLTGKMQSFWQARKHCPSCRTGLVRQVTKLDKKGKIR